MSLLLRRIFLCLIGILAGLAAWPAAESILLFQSGFYSYLVFTAFLGMIFGLIIGGFFGAAEGIILSVRSNIVSGMIHGALIGILGGIAGFLAGQAVLFIIGGVFIRSMRDFNTIGMPLSKAIGWAILGIFIGIVDGVRSRSMNKIKVGVTGGIIGGFLGGLAIEYIRLSAPDAIYARLTGLLIFGLFIGFFYGLIENKFSFGVLRLLNGKYKGTEFLVNQNRMTIGASGKNNIVLSGYEGISDSHAGLEFKGNEVVITSGGPRTQVFVNDDRIKSHQLKMEDVIKIGSAKFLYKYR